VRAEVQRVRASVLLRNECGDVSRNQEVFCENGSATKRCSLNPQLESAQVMS